jgi:hypothetical protein
LRSWPICFLLRIPSTRRLRQDHGGQAHTHTLNSVSVVQCWWQVENIAARAMRSKLVIATWRCTTKNWIVVATAMFGVRGAASAAEVVKVKANNEGDGFWSRIAVAPMSSSPHALRWSHLAEDEPCDGGNTDKTTRLANLPSSRVL